MTSALFSLSLSLFLCLHSVQFVLGGTVAYKLWRYTNSSWDPQVNCDMPCTLEYTPTVDNPNFLLQLRRLTNEQASIYQVALTQDTSARVYAAADGYVDEYNWAFASIDTTPMVLGSCSCTSDGNYDITWFNVTVYPEDASSGKPVKLQVIEVQIGDYLSAGGCDADSAHITSHQNRTYVGHLAPTGPVTQQLRAVYYDLTPGNGTVVLSLLDVRTNESLLGPNSICKHVDSPPGAPCATEQTQITIYGQCNPYWQQVRVTHNSTVQTTLPQIFNLSVVWLPADPNYQCPASTTAATTMATTSTAATESGLVTDTDSSNSGPSKGAIAGYVILAICLCGCVVALIVGAIWYRRKRQNNEQSNL